MNTLSPSTTQTPSNTQSQSETQSPSVTTSSSMAQTPSTTQSPSETQSPSGTLSPSTTQTPSNTQSPSVTQPPSDTLSPSMTQTPSITQSPSETQSPSDTLSPNMTQTPSITQTPSESVSSSVTPSASMTASSSLKPYSIIISAPARITSPLSSATISDGLPVLQLRLSLSRCPSAGDAAVLAAARVYCTVSMNDAMLPVFFALGVLHDDPPTIEASASPAAPVTLAAPCVSAGSALLLPSVFIGAYFRATLTAAAATLSCGIQSVDTNLGSSPNASTDLALTSLPLAILPTRWPLWDDTILVSASGAMRSARLGVVLNVTTALLAAAAACGNSTCAPAEAQSPLMSLSEALASPSTVLTAARAWVGT